MNDTNLWTALVTPMKENGEVDTEDLAGLLRRQEEAGNGVLLLGSTGEGLALGREDKERVIKTAAGLDLDIPLMAGVGGFNLDQQLEWMAWCGEFDVDAFLLVTPLYAKPGRRGQASWFRALMDEAARPCMLYNVPSRTGVKLDPRVLEDLDGHSNLYALKEASGSIDEYQQFRKAAPGLKFFSGDDGLTPFFAMAGCDGLVSVAANVWPKATSRYVELCLEGRGPELLPLWEECASALFAGPNPVPAKVLLKEKGWIGTSVLRAPLTDEDAGDVALLKEADRRIADWYGG